MKIYKNHDPATQRSKNDVKIQSQFARFFEQLRVALRALPTNNTA